MLVDVKKVLPHLEVLEKSKYKFTLTGSRYIGGHRKNSDWDFVADNTKAIRSFLRKNGFEDLKTKMLDTGGLVMNIPMLEQDGLDGYTFTIYQKGNIQVQLSGNVKAKLFARDIIKTHFRKQHLGMERNARRDFWRMLCDVYAFGKDRQWIATLRGSRSY